MPEMMSEKFRQVAGIPRGQSTRPYRVDRKAVETEYQGGWRAQILYLWQGVYYLQPVLRMLGDQDPPCYRLTDAEAAAWMRGDLQI
jgi:hypothetical protein